MRWDRGPELVIERPSVPGKLTHPLSHGVDVRTIIGRLAPHVPHDAVWYVDPAPQPR